MKLSVLMPTYNHEATIAQAIESYLAQNCRFDTELLISDDASTDQTAVIAQQYAKRYPNKIVFIGKLHNEGLLPNYQTLMQAAGGEYCAILESDDYWIDADKLQKQVDFLDAHPQYGLSFTRVRFKQQNATTDSPDCAKLVTHYGNQLYEYMLCRSIIYSPSVVFRRSHFDSYCILEDYVRLHFKTFDYPVWLSLAKHTLVHYVPQVTAVYRIQSGSISNTADLKRRLAFERGVNKTRAYVISLYGTGKRSRLSIKLREWQLQCRIIWRHFLRH